MPPARGHHNSKTNNVTAPKRRLPHRPIAVSYLPKGIRGQAHGHYTKETYLGLDDL
jgi:hypothetical protein